MAWSDWDRVVFGQLWAALMLPLGLDACDSIMRGVPVRAGDVDWFVLRRALRGAPLPDADDYIRVDSDMLDAIAEAGPFR